MPEFVSVATPLMAHEAHLIRTRLEADGITVFLRGEKIASTIGVPNEYSTDWSNPLGGVAVLVPLHQAEQARQILREIKDESRDEELWKDAKPGWPLQITRGWLIAMLVSSVTMWIYGATENIFLGVLAGAIVLAAIVGFGFKNSFSSKSKS